MSRHRNGNSGTVSDSFSLTKWLSTWPCRWLTSTIGICRPSDKPLANEVPTSSEPSSPGPRVNAMALRSALVMPARRSAVSTTGTMFCWWARDASSGTTPPNSSCTLCDAMTLDSSRPSRITAAEVSSHDDSIPSMVTLMVLYVVEVGLLLIVELCRTRLPRL